MAFTVLLRYSTTAQAMDRPSKVLVPRPISSRISSDLVVAFRRMLATSFISTIKVDCPLARSSDAPTRVKIRSQMEMSACFAGTKEPMEAIKVMSATCRI